MCARVVSLPRSAAERRWVAIALVAGGVIAVPMLTVDVSSLTQHAVRAGLTLLLAPFLVVFLATRFGFTPAREADGPAIPASRTLRSAFAGARRRLGWRIDRRAIRNAVLLTALVLPFYVVGSVLPSMRSFYPLWSPGATLLAFLPYALALGLIILATETFYRGLLCVGIRELGVACIFVSPVLYTVWHVGHPPLELVLSAPADVAFGYVDYRSDSILPSVVAHATGFVLLMWLVTQPPVLPQEQVLSLLSWLPVVG